MILVDTSSWVDALRARGRPEVRERVTALVESGNACWCDAVRLELWNSRSGEQERKRLRDFDELVPSLPIDDAVWETSLVLARHARSRGLTVPAIDLVIAACARRHGVSVESTDEHFQLLAKL